MLKCITSMFHFCVMTQQLMCFNVCLCKRCDVIGLSIVHRKDVSHFSLLFSSSLFLSLYHTLYNSSCPHFPFFFIRFAEPNNALFASDFSLSFFFFVGFFAFFYLFVYSHSIKSSCDGSCHY